LTGDPFIDKAGNDFYEEGEKLVQHWYIETNQNFFDPYLSDCGLDGICQYAERPLDRNGDGDYDDPNETLGVLNELWPGEDEGDQDGISFKFTSIHPSPGCHIPS
jgi:hypothetical protein